MCPPFCSVLGPGAQSLLKQLNNSDLPKSERMEDAKKIIREMTVQDWTALVKAFDEWPFAPTVRIPLCVCRTGGSILYNRILESVSHLRSHEQLVAEDTSRS